MTSTHLRGRFTGEEGVAVEKRFNGELPQKYFKGIMERIDMGVEYFLKLCDQFRALQLL